MIIIDKTKKEKIYQIPTIPNLRHRKSKIIWLKKQKLLASIANIKSVSVQVKDIKQMIYSKNSHLISLYAQICLNNINNSYSDNDYITISKTSNLNKSLICALISANWLLDFENVKKKSLEEIQQECLSLQTKISELYKRRTQIKKYGDIDSEIKLFEYKLSCLSEFTVNKVDLESNLGQSTIEKVLVKDRKDE